MNAESPTTGRSLPSKEELLAYQDRWLRKAGIAALAGAFIVAASIVLQRVGLSLPDSNSDADQLAFAHAHDARLIYTAVLQAIGFCLLAGPLLFLFRSAAGRAQRVRGNFAALIALGPIAFGIGLAVSALGTSQSADDFVKQEPAVVQQARQHAVEVQAPAATKKAKGQTTSTTTRSTTHHDHDRRPDPPRPPPPRRPPNRRRRIRPRAARVRVSRTISTNTPRLLIVGGVISTIGVLGLVFGMIYTNLWSMRVGLVTRFWGAIGMAFGLFLVIPLFPPIPGLVLWFAVTGLMFTGVWPRPLPPAWAAGEAIPWQRPGDDLGPPPAERGPAGTVEGSGREVSESPLARQGRRERRASRAALRRDAGAEAQEAQAPGLMRGCSEAKPRSNPFSEEEGEPP